MNTQRANLDTVRLWLKLYLAGAEGFAYIGAAAPIADGGTKWAGGKTFPAAALDDMVGYVDQLDRSGRSGIYLRVTTMRTPPAPGERGGIADSLTLPGFWADIDLAGPGHKHDPAKHDGTELPPDVDTARLIVAATGLPEPTIWQHTGGGVYPWWLFESPRTLADRDDVDQVANVSARLGKLLAQAAKALGYYYGSGIHDLARVLRVVGTVNRKANQERPSYALESTGVRYPYGELVRLIVDAELVDDQPPAPAAPAPRKAPIARPGMSPLDAFEAAADIADVLEPHGWTLTRSLPDGEEHWRRPGGTSDMSAKWGLSGVPVLVVHSSETGLPTGAGQKLTIARTYAHLNYGGDVRALSAALLAYAGSNPGATLPMLDHAPTIGAFIRDACNVKEYSPGTGHENDREAFESLIASDPHPLTLKRQDGEAVDPKAPATPAATRGSAGTGAANGAGDGNQGTPPAPSPSVIAEFSDAQLAETLAARVFAGRYVYTAGLGWLAWTGKRWRECDLVEPIEAVRKFVKAWAVREIKQGGASTERVKALLGLLSGGRINSITALSRGLVVKDAADFDADPNILNTPSGIVDLRTGVRVDHDPAYLCTKMTTAPYVEGASSADWDTALQALPPAVADWLQVRMGQAATGYMPPDDLLLVAQGGGENAKTTLLGTLGRVLGSYYVLVSDRVIMANPDAHPTELMDLRGRRLGLIEETPEARELAVARLKKVVGTPEITARHIRKDSVTFAATHALVVSTNYVPIVRETDHGTWRRLALVKFPYRFVKRPEQVVGPNDRLGDPTLRERLRLDEGSQAAALAWLVEGARRWYAAGRIMPAMPDQVAADTHAWRSESDQILGYIAERITFDQASHVMSTDLLADFNAWLESHGQRAWGDKMLTSRLGDHDEVTAHSVKKARIRHRDGLSRSPIASSGWKAAEAAFGAHPEVPSQYTAWLGLRFRGADEEAPDQAF